MKTQFAFAMTFVAFTIPLALASGGHFHTKKISELAGDCTTLPSKEVLSKALDHVIGEGKLTTDWKDAAGTKIEKKTITKKNGNTSEECVVTLENARKEKRSIFFTQDGYLTWRE